MNKQIHKGCFFSMMLLFACFSLALSGCGKSYWYTTTKDAASFQQDRFQCEGEAATYSANMGKAGKTSIVEKRMIDCMKVKGYGLADESDIPKGAVKFE